MRLAPSNKTLCPHCLHESVSQMVWWETHSSRDNWFKHTRLVKVSCWTGRYEICLVWVSEMIGRDWSSFDGCRCAWLLTCVGLFSAGREGSSRREGAVWTQRSGRQCWGPRQEGGPWGQGTGCEYYYCPYSPKSTRQKFQPLWSSHIKYYVDNANPSHH